MSFAFRRLTREDVALMQALNATLGEAFGEPGTYGGNPPDREYLANLLGSDSFVALAALDKDKVIGGLAAYELKKFEQRRSEIYIYDLAVLESHRRRGVATALIEELRCVAAARGAYVIFVQADRGDEAAIALYSKLGLREDVLHFDIAVRAGKG